MFGRKSKNAMDQIEYLEMVRRVERERGKKFKVIPRYCPRVMKAKGHWKHITDPNAPRFAYSIIEFHQPNIVTGTLDIWGKPKKADIFVDEKIRKYSPKTEKRLVHHELTEVLEVQHAENRPAMQCDVRKAHKKAVRMEHKNYKSKRTRLGFDVRKVYKPSKQEKTKRREKKKRFWNLF